MGADAQRARKLEDADTEPAEAEVVNPTTGAEAVFLYIASGYVSSDDWGNLNPTALLDQIRQNSETANANRRSPGIAGTSRHRLDTATDPEPGHAHRFLELFGVGKDGAKIINAVALKLGRYGFERITFIDEAVNIDTAPQNLLLIANAHHFDAGARYDDYIAGSDRSAAYGVAGLVAGLLGVKVLKVAAAGGPLLLLKKAGWVLLLPLVWLWRLVRGKKTRPMAAPTTSVPRVEPKIAAPSNTNV